MEEIGLERAMSFFDIANRATVSKLIYCGPAVCPWSKENFEEFLSSLERTRLITDHEEGSHVAMYEIDPPSIRLLTPVIISYFDNWDDCPNYTGVGVISHLEDIWTVDDFIKEWIRNYNPQLSFPFARQHCYPKSPAQLGRQLSFFESLGLEGVDFDTLVFENFGEIEEYD